MISYIWHLKRRYDVGYDPDWQQTHAVVLIAPDEQRARALAATQAGDEGAAVWMAPSLVECVAIGMSNDEYADNVVICRDYAEV